MTKVGEKLRGGQRLAAIHDFLRAEVQRYTDQIAHAAVEGPSLKSKHREFDLGEVSGVVRYAIYSFWAVEPLVVAPVQLKLYATGLAGADKDEVLNAVNHTWGTALTDDNEADAVVLAQIARSAHLRTRCATRKQQEVVAKLLGVASSPPRRRPRRKSSINI